MSMELSNDLLEAEARLTGLEHQRADTQNRLGQAVEDGDAEAIINLERRASALDVELFAARARALKLRRADADQQRREALALRDALEANLAEATKVYALKVAEADEARQKMQLLQVKSYGASSRAEQIREDIGELDDELKQLINSRIGGNR